MDPEGPGDGPHPSTQQELSSPLGLPPHRHTPREPFHRRPLRRLCRVSLRLCSEGRHLSTGDRADRTTCVCFTLGFV